VDRPQNKTEEQENMARYGTPFVKAALLATLGCLAGAQSLRVKSPPRLSSGAEASLLLQRAPIVLPAAGSAAELDPPALPLSPLAVTQVIESFKFDDNIALNQLLFIPPDAIGAAGPEHLLAVVNSMIELRTKAGALVWRQSLENFFRAQDTPSPNVPYDPKVVYDHYANRFLVVALESDFISKSRILVAVSKDATPTGPGPAHWVIRKIDAATSIGGENSFADYPGFEVDEEAVYMVSNMFGFQTFTYKGVRLWIIAKAGFYSDGALNVKKRDPYAAAGIATTTMPALVFGAGGAGWNIGTYLVSYGGLTDGLNEYVQVIRVNNPLGTPSFTHQFVNVGNIEAFPSIFVPNAPQKGSEFLLEVDSRDAMDAVWRANTLWFTTTIDPERGLDEGQATVHWFKLDTSAVPAGPITLADQGNVGGEDIAPRASTFYPAIAVNSRGQVKIGFSASAPTIYAGAYVTGRGASDPPGTVRASETVRAGVAPYKRFFDSTRNRWGDYSGIALDPTDSRVCWVFNEYADTRGTPTTGAFGRETGRWGTAWGKCTFP
jgi:hypothetical protein